MRSALGVPIGYLGLVLIGVGIGYSLSGLAAGSLSARLGIGGLLSLSCLLVSVAMLGFSLANHWVSLIVWPVIWGLGSGGIDAALNQYAAEHFPPRHMSWLHACYSIGAAIGPVQMTLAMVWLTSWRLGYVFVACAMLGMTLAFLITRSRWQDDRSVGQEFYRADASGRSQLGDAQLQDAHVSDSQASLLAAEAKSPNAVDTDSRPQTSLTAALRMPQLWQQMALFFFYTGLESLLGQWSFTLLTQARGSATASAGMWVGGFFASIAVGRIVAGVMTELYGVERWLRASLWLLLLATALLQLPVGSTLGGMVLVMVGLGLAPVFPCLMYLTPTRVGGQLARHAVGLQVAAATIGAAGIPALIGVLIPSLGLESIARAALILVGVIIIIERQPSRSALIGTSLPQHR